MNRRTLIALAVAGALVLGGCSESTQPQKNTAQSSGQNLDTMEKTTLTVGMELAYPPFEGKDASGNPAGVSIDFMRDFG